MRVIREPCAVSEQHTITHRQGGVANTWKRKKIDCRGLACPNPVIMTKERIERGDIDALTVLVDNAAAKENVSRLFTHKGF